VTKKSWVPVIVAANLLKKSDRTIRRWAAAGKISSQTSPDGLLVDVGQMSTETVTEVDMSDVSELVSKISKLEAENVLLRDERDFLRQAMAMSMDNVSKLIESKVQEMPTNANDNAGRRQSTPSNANGDANWRWWQFWK